jgi:hypothetical protein
LCNKQELNGQLSSRQISEEGPVLWASISIGVCRPTDTPGTVLEAAGFRKMPLIQNVRHWSIAVPLESQFKINFVSRE